LFFFYSRGGGAHFYRLFLSTVFNIFPFIAIPLGEDPDACSTAQILNRRHTAVSDNRFFFGKVGPRSDFHDNHRSFENGSVRFGSVSQTNVRGGISLVHRFHSASSVFHHSPLFG